MFDLTEAQPACKSMKRVFPVALLLAASILAVSCGVKGPPLPPPVPAPAAPRNFSAVVREGCVELRWRAPEVQPPEKVEAVRYEVLRAPELGASETPAYMLLDRIPSTSYGDCSLGLHDRSIYRVRGISAADRRGDLSPEIRVINDWPHAAPGSAGCAGGDGYVELSWTAPPDAPAGVGYNVYRAKATPVFGARPANPMPITETKYLDGPLDNGVAYFYEIRPVMATPGYVPSEGSAEIVSCVPSDRVAPVAPQGFTAVWTDQGVVLTWLRNEEPDLAGYVVKRRRRGLGDFRELNLEPVKDNRYVDITARAGVEYEYIVQAVDKSAVPNYSPASEVQTVYREP